MVLPARIFFNLYNKVGRNGWDSAAAGIVGSVYNSLSYGAVGNIIIPHFSCHYLRHTFCTRFCEKETNVKVIQAIMGHANIETTMDIYAEVTDMKKQEAIQNLSRNLDVF